MGGGNGGGGERERRGGKCEWGVGRGMLGAIGGKEEVSVTFIRCI